LALEAGHEVAIVLTQPDRPAGRGLQSSPSPVKALATRRGLQVLQPATLRAPELAERLRQARADAMVVAAYGLLLPPEILVVAAHGAINIHASLLPRWRGAAPIQRALLAGDAETGVSIMQMDAGLDTGPLFMQRRLAIAADDDAGTLHDKLAGLGAHAILEVLAAIAGGVVHASAQPASGATYARKIEKSEASLDWSRPAAQLERAVRAFRPSPGAQMQVAEQPTKVWRARVAPGEGAPGTVLEADEVLLVACGGDALAITELQPAGGRRMSVAEFLRGRRIAPGTRLR
jgi:methionyl-tRNA formyltransferase